MSYAATPTLSVEASHANVTELHVRLLTPGLAGTVGSSRSARTPNRSRSRWGPPLVVFAVTRMLLLPALSVTCSITCVCQIFQAPVRVNGGGNFATVPLTLTIIGSSVGKPLAKRNSSVVLPARAELTVQSTK